MPQTRAACSAGNTIELVAQFRDSAGDLVAASGVVTYIFDPSGDTTDNNTALSSLSPTMVSSGIYVNNYVIPTSATPGTWWDKWEGMVDYEAMTAYFTFTVVNSGTIETTELKTNNQITVTLSQDIADTDGNTLGDNYDNEDYDFYFSTEFTPLYTNYNQMDLLVGPFMQNLAKDTVWRLILSASLEASRYNRRDADGTEQVEWYETARRMWTRCRAQEMILLAVLREHDVRRKRLGDIDVTWSAEAINTRIDEALACKQKWQYALESGGRKIRKGVTFVKGEWDPDRPAFGRTTIPSEQDPNNPGMPAANRKEPTYNYRRYQKGFRRRPW